MKPDYGYKLLREGYNPKCPLRFQEFPMSYLGILGGGQFTTSA